MNRLLLFALTLLSIAPVKAEVIEIDDVWDIKYRDRPMIVEVYTTWCPPCKQYGPIFDRVAREYEGRVDFYRMDVDGEDAQNFMEITSVPTTIFIWAPKGDATVKHSAETGLMGYEELKRYVDNTISKHSYSTKINTSSSLSWVNFDESPFMIYADNTPQLRQYIGEWIGSEEGYETRLWITKGDGEIQICGGTLDPKRNELVNTVFWIVKRSDWADNGNSFILCDKLPDLPATPFSWYSNGTLRERKFSLNGNQLTMTVKCFKLNDGECNNTPYKTYTVVYHKADKSSQFISNVKEKLSRKN